MNANYTISIDGSVIHEGGKIAIFDYANVCYQLEAFIKKNKLKVVRKKKWNNNCFAYECVDNNNTQIVIEVWKCSISPSYNDWEWDKV